MATDKDHKLPESLRLQLKSFRSRLWRVRLLEVFFCSILCFLVSFLCFFVSDRLWDTPHVVAWALLIGGACGLVIWSPYWCVRWIWRRRRPEQLARLISQNMPALGDKLLGVVELAGDFAKQLSPALHKAAMKQVAEESSAIDLTGAIPRPRHKKMLLLMLLLGLLVGGLVWFVPEAVDNTWRRWSDPSQVVERYTFTQLKPYGASIVVPIGESVILPLFLSSETEQRPEMLQYSLGKMMQETPLNMEDESYVLRLPGLQEEEVLLFKVGDYRGHIRIIPKMRPSIVKATLKVKYPVYLERAGEELALRAGTGSALIGSQISLELVASQDLDTAFLKGEGAKIESIQENKIVAAALNMDDKVREWSLAVKDKDGLLSQKEMKFLIEPIKDQMPVVELRSGAVEHFLLEDETLPVDLRATDDYGLKYLGIEWQGERALVDELNPSETNAHQGELVVEQGTPAANTLKGEFLFQARALKLSPQRIKIRAFTQDYFPDRKRIYSEPVVLYILTLSEHAQMVRGEMDRLNSQLDDVARQMDILSDEVQRLQALKDEELQTKAVQSRLRDLADQEQGLARQLEELTQRGEELFKKAARNKNIDPQGMKDFMEGLQLLKPLPETEFKEAQENFESSSDQANTPEKSKKDLESGAKQHEQAKHKLKEAQKKLSQAAANMEASTFVARLRQVAQKQEAVTGLLSEQLGVIGLGMDELDPKQQREFKQTSMEQSLLSRELFWISEDLNFYQSRSKEAVFGELYKMMSVYDIPTRMDQLLKGIDNAQTARSMEQSSAHAATLLSWAQYIDDYKNQERAGGGGGGGGGGGADESMNEEDFEFMLKLMRMIQTQQDIRMRTRALEDLQRQNKPSLKKLP